MSVLSVHAKTFVLMLTAVNILFLSDLITMFSFSFLALFQHSFKIF